MLTFNIYTGGLQRPSRRQSWTAFPFFLLWWVIVFISFAALLLTNYTELDYSGFPPEDLKISGAPATPTQLLNSITPATAQAVLARAVNPNRGVATPTALFTTHTTTAPTRPIHTPAPATAPAGSYSDSDEEETTKMTTTSDPLAYSTAFRESEFILKQVMKARITKKGSRTDDELLAYQTDQVIETAQLDAIQMDKVMELQASTAELGPIKAGSYMQNKRMTPAKWPAITDILHRIILRARSLRIPSDSRKAREMLQQTHADVIQDQQRGPPFLIRFNQFFNISGIADSEYQHYLQQSINGTEHPKMKTSAGEDLQKNRKSRQLRSAGTSLEMKPKACS